MRETTLHTADAGPRGRAPRPSRLEAPAQAGKARARPASLGCVRLCDLERMRISRSSVSSGTAALANVVVIELQVRADDKPPAQESRLEQFRGRWSTTREVREGEKVRHSQLVLEFRGDEVITSA